VFVDQRVNVFGAGQEPWVTGQGAPFCMASTQYQLGRLRFALHKHYTILPAGNRKRAPTEFWLWRTQKQAALRALGLGVPGFARVLCRPRW